LRDICLIYQVLLQQHQFQNNPEPTQPKGERKESDKILSVVIAKESEVNTQTKEKPQQFKYCVSDNIGTQFFA